MHPIRIGYLSTMYHTSHILRTMDWVQARLGRVATWQLFGTGPAMVDAFAMGALDIGYLGVPPAMIGIGRGVPIVCIAGGHVEGTVMIGPRHAPRAVAADDIPAVLHYLAGKKIGVPARGSIHDVIMRWLINTMGASTPEVVNYPWADLIPEAINEHVIAAGAGTPQLAAVARTFYDLDILIGPELLWPFNPSYGIVVRRALLQERTLLEEFLLLHEDACNLIRLQPEAAARIVADAVRVVDETFVKAVFSLSPRYCASLPRPYIDAAMAFVPVLMSMGFLSTTLTEEAVFDSSFIAPVHPENHHYGVDTTDSARYSFYPH
ncbi:MAG: ABC transporter substrate-binding protein [Desulfobacterota bacterium]|nr:ABC transporter substrate-binding protein [Thermodesulfobacteriota bacterium]